MAIHAEAVDILVRKGRFEPEVALGIAEAIEVSFTLEQLVTVPILDARLQELRHELKSDIQTLRAEIQAIRVEFRGELSSELGKLRAELHVEIHKVAADLTRWVLLTMLGSVALSMSGNWLMRAFAN